MPGKKSKSASNILEMQNAANTLFANIRFQSVDDPIRAILLTSSVPNEGKTTTAILLAQAIAAAGNRTLVVECDMRRRSLANALDVHAAQGLYSVMTGEAQVARAVVPTQVPNLYFLDAEPGIPSPADLLASHRMAMLVEALRQAYDYVVFDTPPVGTFVDAAVLAKLVDGCILVVRPNGPKRSDLLAAYDQMIAADANMLGICSTFEEGTGSEYYYAYYTKSGKRVRKDDDNIVSNATAVVDTAGVARGDVEVPSVEAPTRSRGSHAARSQQGGRRIGEGSGATVGVPPARGRRG